MIVGGVLGACEADEEEQEHAGSAMGGHGGAWLGR
jgi:hypothetical protein